MSASILSTSLVNFINADAGDKLAKADLREQIVRAQVVKCLRGNATEYRAGRELATSLKTKVGRAWSAGFAAIAETVGAAEPARYPYKGKLTPEVAQAIDAAADPLVLAFAVAFDAVVPMFKPEPTEAQKAEAEKRKAEAAQKRKEKALALAAESGMVDAESHAAEVKLAAERAAARALTFTPGELVEALVPAITAGQLTDDEITMIRAALSLLPATQAPAPAPAQPAMA